jgi:hypothetical protein
MPVPVPLSAEKEREKETDREMPGMRKSVRGALPEVANLQDQTLKCQEGCAFQNHPRMGTSDALNAKYT